MEEQNLNPDLSDLKPYAISPLKSYRSKLEGENKQTNKQTKKATGHINVAWLKGKFCFYILIYFSYISKLIQYFF